MNGNNKKTELNRLVEEINVSSTKTAEKRFQSGVRFSLVRIVFRPPSIFIENLLCRRKILCGFRGVAASALTAYEEFVALLKLWELEHVTFREKR